MFTSADLCEELKKVVASDKTTREEAIIATIKEIRKLYPEQWRQALVQLAEERSSLKKSPKMKIVES